MLSFPGQLLKAIYPNVCDRWGQFQLCFPCHGLCPPRALPCQNRQHLGGLARGLPQAG